MNSWTKCTCQRFVLFLSSCRSLLPCCSFLHLFPHTFSLFFLPPIPLFPPICLLSLIAAQYKLSLSISSFLPIFLWIYFFMLALFHSFPQLSLLLSSIPFFSDVQVFLASVISCTEQLFHFPRALQIHPAIFLLFSFLFGLYDLPFFLLSERGNPENFIRPLFSVRQETTSIFLWKRQGLWLTQAAWLQVHAHT